jgi:hypothetical protein
MERNKMRSGSSYILDALMRTHGLGWRFVSNKRSMEFNGLEGKDSLFSNFPFSLIAINFQFNRHYESSYFYFTGGNIITEAHVLAGSIMMFLSNFDVILILSVIILLIILAIVFVYIIGKLNEEQTKAANYKNLVLNEFEELIKFMDGETKFVTGEIKIKNNQESFDNLIERISLTSQSNEDMKDKLKQVCRKLREN